MPGNLPINLNALLHQRTVEGDRIEYKVGWTPDDIIKTLCAFGNDFENLGGGYPKCAIWQPPELMMLCSNGHSAASQCLNGHRCTLHRPTSFPTPKA